jgi:hypothetical protein
MRRVPLLFAPLLIGGCDFALSCTEERIAGLGISLKDPDGKQVCHAKVTARDDEYSEELATFGGPDCTYFGAWERGGTYQIEVEKRGFEPSSAEIDVDEDACHVEAVGKEITLQAKPGCDGPDVPGIEAIVRRANGQRECFVEVTSAKIAGTTTHLAERFELTDDLEGGCGYRGAFDQAGKFEVVVRIPGEGMFSELVDVTEDDCRLNTKRVDLQVP